MRLKKSSRAPGSPTFQSDEERNVISTMTEEERSNSSTLVADCVRHQAIHDGVLQLLEDTRIHEERRWEPRVLYVRPVRILFEDPQTHRPDRKHTLLALTTDISLGGVGIVSLREVPARRLILKFPAVQFACEVRWSKCIDHQVFRYGLSFRDCWTDPHENDDERAASLG